MKVDLDKLLDSVDGTLDADAFLDWIAAAPAPFDAWMIFRYQSDGGNVEKLLAHAKARKNEPGVAAFLQHVQEKLG